MNIMRRMEPKEYILAHRLEIKSIAEDSRTISGMATTPETDRMGDIVESAGATYAADIPLLWQHQMDKPVGRAQLGKATKSGIPFTATVAAIADPGPLKDLVDMAWQSVKAQLVQGVSIGFRALEYSFMDDGGIRFTKSEIYELSLVTIPANQSAQIESFKSFAMPRDPRAGVRLLSRAAPAPRDPRSGIPLIR